MKKIYFYLLVISLNILALSFFTGCGKESGPDSAAADMIVEPGQYLGLSVTKMSTEVTDEEVDIKLENDLLNMDPYEEITDRTDVREGDIVNIDFTGKLDGTAFEGGSAKGYDLTIGSHAFIKGFEEALIGLEKGETKDIDLTFPADYGEPSLAGKDVVFTVTVNKLQKKAELSDKLVKEKTGGEYDDLASYRAHVREELEKENEEYATSAMYIDLWEQVVDNSVIRGTLPKELVSEKKDTLRTNALTLAEGYGMTVEEFINSVLGKTEEEFESEIEDYAMRAAKETLILEAIADREGLNVTKKELEEGIDNYVTTYGYSSKDEFTETVNMKEFEEYILKSKVQEYIAEHAEIKTE
ncbi:MAG: trigger factor [Lachnospiraceae bacterium]|nr:trigger factor [Lachnospiraceae bacterium]